MDDVQAMRPARRSWFGRGRTRALLSVGLLLGMGAVATSAYFSDQVTVPGVQIKSGTMHIDLDGRDKVRNETFTLAFNLDDLAENQSKSKTLPVKNNSLGDVTLTYKIKGAATNPLGANLRLTVVRGSTANPDGTCTTGTSTVFTSQPFDGIARPGAGLSLAPGVADSLCLRVTRIAGVLPGGSTSAVSFTFDATQVQ